MIKNYTIEVDGEKQTAPPEEVYRGISIFRFPVDENHPIYNFFFIQQPKGYFFHEDQKGFTNIKAPKPFRIIKVKPKPKHMVIDGTITLEEAREVIDDRLEFA